MSTLTAFNYLWNDFVKFYRDPTQPRTITLKTEIKIKYLYFFMKEKAACTTGAPTPPLCHCDTSTDSHTQLLPVPHGAHQDGASHLVLTSQYWMEQVMIPHKQSFQWQLPSHMEATVREEQSQRPVLDLWYPTCSPDAMDPHCTPGCSQM